MCCGTVSWHGEFGLGQHSQGRIGGNYSKQAVAMCSDLGVWQNRSLGPGSGKRISENGPREVCFSVSWALPYTLKGFSLPVFDGLKDVERH